MTSLPPALPPIRTTVEELAAGLDRAEARRLIEHDSMRVYFDLDFRGDEITINELPTTRARAALILPTLAGLIDARGSDLSVVDLACSPGYFMFKLAQMGFGNVTGVDARADHHVQFGMLQRSWGFPGLRHVQADIYEFLEAEIAAGRRYDVCLLFGFLYHSATPVELLRMIRRICGHAMVLDTTVNRRRDASLQLYEEPTGWSRASTTKLSMMPSPAAVPMLLEAAGFTGIERIPAAPAVRDLNPGGDRVDYYFDTRPARGPLHRFDSLRYRIGRRLGLPVQKPAKSDGRALYLARA